VDIMQGGTTANTIAQHSTAEIDLRIPTPELAEEMVERLLALKPHDPDVTLEITGGINRPPYVKDAAITALFEQARACASELGLDLRDVPMTGGGSDGNFTAALGIPTLDGLGADGAGAHTDDEHILYSSLVPRASLLLRLMETLR